jgi:hypothetical protein
MSLKAPNLDDRSFGQLLEEATLKIRRSCPGWTDLSPGDPGMALIETFAHLTEVMIYRLNRLPEKAYVEFLRLIGVKLHPPSAALVNLRFTADPKYGRDVQIPAGTAVTLRRSSGQGEPPVFITARKLVLPPGPGEADVIAFHATAVEAEEAGEGTGLPGLSLLARRPPIVSPLGENLALTVAVEALPGELDEGVRALEHQGKSYRIWREVENFTDLGPDRFVYVAERTTGTIAFAPAVSMRIEEGPLEPVPRALAEVPAAGRRILLWYFRGGGPEGNVSAKTLDTLKKPIPGVLSVTNPAAATGGRAAESMENALVRGPQELHSLKRAVTASDFELVALRYPGAIDRARAYTKAELWKHASPGTVEVLLVPHLPEAAQGRVAVTFEMLRERQTEEARRTIQAALDERKPLGTVCHVAWSRYKMVRAEGRVVTHREENTKSVEKRVLERLHTIISPLRTPLQPSGWAFGEPLRAFHIFETVRNEPGVKYIDGVSFYVDEVPSDRIHSMAADQFQPDTWYVAAGSLLFRSQNDGAGWEPAGRFAGEEAVIVRVHPERPGILAVATRMPGDKPGTKVYASCDCGESWESLAQMAFRVEDMAWTMRDTVPILYLATEKGIYEMSLLPGSNSVPVRRTVDPANPDRGFYAVAIARDSGGGLTVAVASAANGGVYLSNEEGGSATFRFIGLKGEDVRTLAIQYDGPRAFLWAGKTAFGDDPGTGCSRWELMGTKDPVDLWQHFKKGWAAGSCRSIVFQGSRVLAATFKAGVVWLETAVHDREPEWTAPNFVGCRLPLRDQGRLHPVEAVAVDPAGRLILAGGLQGVYASENRGATYTNCSQNKFDTVTLPEGWLFCSGAHKIVVVSEDEATGH